MEPISINIEDKKCFFYQDENANKCIIQPVDEHELGMLDAEIKEIKRLTNDNSFLLVAVLIDDWNKELSPWKAPAVFGKEGFGCGAADTLCFIRDFLISYIRSSYRNVSEYYLGGYSLSEVILLPDSFHYGQAIRQIFSAELQLYHLQSGLRAGISIFWQIRSWLRKHI